MRIAIAVFAVTCLATTTAQAVTPIKPGTYHCLAGSSRMMLALGDMKVTGMTYSFKAIGGPATSGSYALTAKGYHFSGDIGAIKNAQIVESAPDGTPGEFWFSYKGGPNSAPTSVSCSP